MARTYGGPRPLGGGSTGIPKPPPAEPRPSWWETQRRRAEARRASPGRTPWRKNIPLYRTTAGLAKLPFRLARFATTGLTGAVGGTLYPQPISFLGERPIATEEQEFDWARERGIDLYGQPIEGMRVRSPFDPSAQVGGGTDMGPATYGEGLPSAYDEDFLKNVSGQLATRETERWEEEMATGEGASYLDLIRHTASRAESEWRDWLFPDREKEAIEQPAVYDMNKRGKSDAPKEEITSRGTSSVDGVSKKTVVPTSFQDVLDMVGSAGGEVDWKRAEKKINETMAWEALGGLSNNASSNLIGGMMDLAQMNNTQRWRAIQLWTSDKVTLYPYTYEGGRVVLDTAGNKPLIHQFGWKGYPEGYTDKKPTEPATDVLTEQNARLENILRKEGLVAGWAYEIGLGANNASLGMEGNQDAIIGKRINAVWRKLHPEDINIKLMPNIPMLTSMIQALNGRTVEEAIAAEDLTRKEWKDWVEAFGNWIPPAGMLK